MKLSRAITFFPVILLLTSFDMMSAQGILTELAAMFGLLPTSQLLLAGGGLLGLKLMILSRFMSLIGLICDQRKDIVSNITQSVPGINGSIEITTLSPVVISSGFYGLPDILHRFLPGSREEGRTGKSMGGNKKNKDSDKVNISTTTTSPSTTLSSLEVVNNATESLAEVGNKNHGEEGFTFDEQSAFFPIPGLKVGFDNETKKNVLVFDQSLQPTILIPSVILNGIGIIDDETGILHLNPREDEPEGNETTTNFTDTSSLSGEQLGVLLYPLFPTKVNLTGLKQEEGFSSAINESLIMIKLMNGTIIPAELFKVDQKEPKGKRSRRQVEHSLSVLFDFVHSLDEKDCFAKIVCEVGAETAAVSQESNDVKKDKEQNSAVKSIFGEHASSVAKFFSTLKLSNFDPSTHSYHYVSHFYFGKTHGHDSCSRGSSCDFDFASFISSLRKPPP